MWMLHFLSHLKNGGMAGFVMASGELSNGETARFDVPKALVEHDYVDCIVQLTSQLFANTQIPCSLWFLSKNRTGGNGYRKRTGEVLFIDGRKLGILIPGSRKQKQLSSADFDQIASPYRTFKRSGIPAEVAGFARVAPIGEIRDMAYSLTPGRYVGSAAGEDEAGPIEQRLPILASRLRDCFSQSRKLSVAIDETLARLEPRGE